MRSQQGSNLQDISPMTRDRNHSDVHYVPCEGNTTVVRRTRVDRPSGLEERSRPPFHRAHAELSQISPTERLAIAWTTTAIIAHDHKIPADLRQQSGQRTTVTAQYFMGGSFAE